MITLFGKTMMLLWHFFAFLYFQLDNNISSETMCRVKTCKSESSSSVPTETVWDQRDDVFGATTSSPLQTEDQQHRGDHQETDAEDDLWNDESNGVRHDAILKQETCVAPFMTDVAARSVWNFWELATYYLQFAYEIIFDKHATQKLMILKPIFVHLRQNMTYKIFVRLHHKQFLPNKTAPLEHFASLDQELVLWSTYTACTFWLIICLH